MRNKCKSDAFSSNQYQLNLAKINFLRWQYDLSQSDLASKLDMTQSAISRALSGETNSRKMRRALVRFFVKLTKGAVTESDLLVASNGTNICDAARR